MGDITLEWSSHNKTLSEDLFNYYKNEEMVDTTVCFEDGKIKAHRMVLSASSTKLENVFKIDEGTGHVYFTNILKESMKYVIEFMYRGRVVVPSQSLRGVLEAAEYFQVKGFEQANGSYNPIKPENKHMEP